MTSHLGKEHNHAMHAFKNLRILVFLSIAFLLGTPAFSRAEVSFSISPIRLEMSGDPGGSYTDAVEVRNEGSEKVRIKVTMQDWRLTEDGTPVFEKAKTEPHSCTGWLKINPVDFLLQPGEKKMARYSVTIPPGTKDGGYWGAFIFETVPPVEPGQKAKAVAIKGNIASIIYVVAGKPQPAGDILDMRYKRGKDQDSISVKIKNSGAAPFRMKGNVSINDGTGKSVSVIDFPDAPVLAESTRTFTLPIKEKLPPGNYVSTATVDIGAKSVLAGDLPFQVK